MNIYKRCFKIIQSFAHFFVSKFEDPIRLAEQGIRDLKKDFDDSMKNVAEVKAIAIGAKKEIEVKTQIAKDYEEKAYLLLQKAQKGEMAQEEADRLATYALEKRQMALGEVKKLSSDVKNYDEMLIKMEKKIVELKNKIKEWEGEYASLKARAAVAKTTKKINMQLSSINSDSTVQMLEDMKTKIQAEENLAEAYGETVNLGTTADEEINKAIGTSKDSNIQASLDMMKQKILENPDNKPSIPDNLEDLKREFEGK